MKICLLTCVLILAGVIPDAAGEPLLLVGQSPTEAIFESAQGDGTLQFQVEEQLKTVAAKDLVRWSTAKANLRHSEILLANGSRVVLAEAWTGQRSWQLDGDSVLATTKLFGKIRLSQKQVRGLVLRIPASLQRRTLFFDRLLRGKNSIDRLHLTNGDQVEGTFAGLTRTDKGLQQINFQLDGEGTTVHIPEERVAAITLHSSAKPTAKSAKWQVDTRDGSLLIADSLVASGKQLRMRLADGLELIGADSRDVASLRSLTTECVYLSDLDAAEYQHIPYLEIPWQYSRDRNVQRGPLQAEGRSYSKGIGMHSASRLTYRLDPVNIDPVNIDGRFQRFVADIAIDEVAGRKGSVIFRVYLLQGNGWQQAFESPIVRGGDPPMPVSVELGQAKQIALVTDFADRGDECDYANWLDARLE